MQRKRMSKEKTKSTINGLLLHNPVVMNGVMQILVPQLECATQGDDQISCCSPFRSDSSPSFSLNTKKFLGTDWSNNRKTYGLLDFYVLAHFNCKDAGTINLYKVLDHVIKNINDPNNKNKERTFTNKITIKQNPEKKLKEYTKQCLYVLNNLCSRDKIIFSYCCFKNYNMDIFWEIYTTGDFFTKLDYPLTMCYASRRVDKLFHPVGIKNIWFCEQIKRYRKAAQKGTSPYSGLFMSQRNVKKLLSDSKTPRSIILVEGIGSAIRIESAFYERDGASYTQIIAAVDTVSAFTRMLGEVIEQCRTKWKNINRILLITDQDSIQPNVIGAGEEAVIQAMKHAQNKFQPMEDNVIRVSYSVPEVTICKRDYDLVGQDISATELLNIIQTNFKATIRI